MSDKRELYYLIDQRALLEKHPELNDEIYEMPYVRVRLPNLDGRYYTGLPLKGYEPAPHINNIASKNDWIVYWILRSSDLHMGIGCFKDERTAVANAYLAAADYICNDGGEFVIGTLDFLEGGEDMYFDVIDKNGEVEITVYLLKMLED